MRRAWGQVGGKIRSESLWKREIFAARRTPHVSLMVIRSGKARKSEDESDEIYNLYAT